MTHEISTEALTDKLNAAKARGQVLPNEVHTRLR